MMTTPIVDFVRRYRESSALRLHMPGHKGAGFLGCEWADITEIDGADSLFAPSGIIAESEANASRLFGCPTFYSAEGSSLGIRAMLYLALLRSPSGKSGRRPLIMAGRNAHRAFISAAALLDFRIRWIYGENYLSCRPTAKEIDLALSENGEKPVALYLTAPDYLGASPELGEIAEVCHKHGVLLLVDNAHGAYLKFLPESRHPIDLGADLVCDSAHKTLPVLTGGAYLHISPDHSDLIDAVKEGMCLFASTSPSYLILESLDQANVYLESHRERLFDFLPKVDRLKSSLRELGWTLFGDEELKLTLCPKPFGYTGGDLSRFLSDEGLICEFADPDHLVIMLTPELGDVGLERILSALAKLPRREPILAAPPPLPRPRVILTPRLAILSPSESVPVGDSAGRILATPSVSCPPAVPILICGEEVDEDAVRCFEYYGVECVRCCR